MGANVQNKDTRRTNVKTPVQHYMARKLSKSRLRAYHAQQREEQGVVDKMLDYVDDRVY